MGRLGDAAKKISPGGGLFIKFQDKTEITLRLLSDPWIRTTRFENQRKLDENGKPEITVKTSFMWPVWDYAEKQARVLEQGPSVANQIDAIDDAWKNDGTMPPSYDLTITATGELLQRRYTVVPTPHQGTMPVSSEIDIPDMQRMAGDGAVRLADFLAGTEPVEQGFGGTPKRPTYEDAQALSAESQDVVLKDVDTENPINLDDIPF
jgi:hypothetical protein